jgi:hypothetical protein
MEIHIFADLVCQIGNTIGVGQVLGWNKGRAVHM